MIKEIRIRNFAIIENLAVNFEQGLNVLTGETGAGKSIILGALNLLLGGRADTDSIRSGETTAFVEGAFEVTDPATLDLIRECGIEMEDGELLVKRQVSNAGKNRCLLNDSPVTVSTLAKIGDRLVDLHGQHDHQALLHPETHIDLLDLYGKSQELRNEFALNFSDYQTQAKKLQSMKMDEQERLQKEEFLSFQLAEIDAAGLSEEEEEEIKAESHKLKHAEKIRAGLQQSQSLLTDDQGSILENLGQVLKELEAVLEIDPGLAETVERSRSAYYELEEVVESLRGYNRSLEFNPNRLEEIEDRLAEINGLKRKFGNDITEILKRRDQIAEELQQLASNDENMKALEEELRQKEKVLSKLAIRLAEKRESAAKSFTASVEKELKELSMGNVQFGVRFDYPSDPDGFILFRKEKMKASATGLGTLEFMFSPNPGEELRPLVKIASGGEVSRVMLALKSILNDQDTIPVMIFDEVDTGIGGGVAEKVGLKLQKVASTKQVLCITHLPQIAGLASSHFRIEKQIKSKRTHSTIHQLEHEERVEELARMSSGETITDASLEHAREMLKPTNRQ
ncbi:MAG: DNA repair protein RecN [Nitrospina sp.]|nr:DNA repair protein RecN [Nitrospina sp.]MBT3855372.1 DNA repair protein RecN [Nitrospina sp.]MBT4106082.1 DNA repair protein RecN [Nitrospina sp.]MBT5959234.1 DNA repair protein RecN [Nitrospina sp.]MBT7476979.1 DNA repair protein RecN [Nitrospina sp.]